MRRLRQKLSSIFSTQKSSAGPTGVGERQLRAGVRALATHDHPAARRPAAQLEAVADLGHPGALARFAVLAYRRTPCGFVELEDRPAQRLGQIEAHEEVDACGAQLVGELVRRR